MTCPQHEENFSINMYADDTVMCFTNLWTSEIARVVQDDLKRVVQWMESSRRILNQSNTKSMLFGSWQNLAKSPNFCIQLYGKTLEKVAIFSYLGVVDFNWLNLASRRKMHKCILVFKSLNNLVHKYLKQYFTRTADLHDHATTRSNDLHPPKA